ncbi:MAG TPA: hypothetical protein DEP53_13715 [Bacteroidetes bacterium]|nr:hypothetical protein [Bacteroidota bacterium]
METIAQTSAEQFAGKTYSLRPDGSGPDGYYRLIEQVADSLLPGGTSLSDLLDTVRWLGAGKRNIRRLLKSNRSTPDTRLLETLRSTLSPYTTSTSGHLKHLRAFDRLDRTLTTTEEQHHLFMLEIELGNRLHAEQFRSADLKIAMLPHCLRDLDAECRAAERDIDYVCKGCTDACNVNLASRVLRLHKVKPYIRMEADLKSLFRKIRKNGETVGVLGIACVPELAKGMRLCHKYGVPAVGVPLDANRCARWWGTFYPNTVNLEKLESLLS